MIGTLVGHRFRIERVLGRGGMGEVYAARHVTTGKDVALKVMHSGDGVWRFTREARAATALRHPNVVEVYDLFEDDDGTPVMVMELLRGETFAAYREARGALTLQATSQLLLPVLQAIRAAHAMGIVHRDIKPDNIFLAETEAGRVPKILDFGIAKMLDPAKLGSGTHGRETKTGAILGTPAYMSYEQAMSEPVDARTDVWSVGVIVFESLSGRRPIVFDNLGQMYVALVQGTVPSIRDAIPELPFDAAEAIDRCLEKRPESRPNDLTPLIDVLARYVDGTAPGAAAGGRVVAEPPWPSHPPGGAAGQAPVRRPPRSAAVVAALLVVGTSAGAGFYAYEHGQTARRAAGEVPAPVPVAPGVPVNTAPIETGKEEVPPLEPVAPRPSPVAPSAPVAGRTQHATSTASAPPDARDASTGSTRKHGIVDTDPYSPTPR